MKLHEKMDFQRPESGFVAYLSGVPNSISSQVSLRPFNTFGLDVRARYFARFSNADELDELIRESPSGSLFVLGGGSNVLFAGDIDALVLKNECPGIRELHEDSEYVYVQAGAGVAWHDLVQFCVERNWGGLENLSLIPGSVGAAPIQNIGAYGVELEDVFWDLEAFHLGEKRIHTFTRHDCAFGYRDSVFKNRFKNQFAILSVTLRLHKKPRFNTQYGAIEQELEQMGIQELSIRAVSQAVIRIRQSKLPDPAVLGNAGSFFKNPEIPGGDFAELSKRYPGIAGFPLPDGRVKLAAGWLIEHCGPAPEQSWKGYRRGDAGVHARQALVLVNYGNASGKDILELAAGIEESVFRSYRIKLEKEVNVISG